MRLLQRNVRRRRRATAAASCSRSTASPAGRAAGGRVDWFFYVNGIEAPTGRGRRRSVHDGDRDLVGPPRLGRARATCPAVVGSFPEPFLHGVGRQAAAGPRSSAPTDARPPATTRPTRLGDAGVIAAHGRRSAPASARTRCASLVGPWSALRERRRRSRSSSAGPAASGVYARSRADGRAIALLDAARATSARTLGAGRRPVAATRVERRSAPTWVVTGTDDAGVAAAARALDERRARTAASRSRSTAARADRAARWRADELPPPRQPAARRARGGRRARWCAALAALRAASFDHPLVLGARRARRARRRARRGRRRASCARAARWSRAVRAR